MNARIGAVVGIVLGVVGVAVIALLAIRALDGADAPAADVPPTTSATATPTAAPADAPTAPTGTYVDYSPAAIAQADGRILLFFHASWCPQCRAIEDDIEAQGVPAGVTIVKVDFDARQDLRQEYGITLQTTFVEVDPDGEALQTHVA